MKWALLAVGACFSALPAAACTCGYPTDLRADFEAAVKRATTIRTARVINGDAQELEVVESFKGDSAPGTRFWLPRPQSDCDVGFRTGQFWLLYDHPRQCGRSRPVQPNDPELEWLRAKKLPPIPVAIVRADVSCERCDIAFVGQQLGLCDSKGLPDAGGTWFVTYEGPAMVGIGYMPDGGAFEVEENWQGSWRAACPQRVTRRWCKRLEPREDRRNRLGCVEPSEPEVLCDAFNTRTVRWHPPELPANTQCKWHGLFGECKLPAPRYFDGGVPAGPRLVCLTSEFSDFVCHLE